LTLKEIAGARSVSIGTVKAQTNSILKKSGSSNRAAFLGCSLTSF
jgi:DNA-binding NarL/FixJ family response regulator